MCIQDNCETILIRIIKKENQLYGTLPVLWSPTVYKSDEVFEYENPTPAGDSRKSKFATATKHYRILLKLKAQKQNQIALRKN